MRAQISAPWRSLPSRGQSSMPAFQELKMKARKSKYCSIFDSELENSLDETLGKIAAEVSLSPIAPRLDFLILGGKYGRGEGEAMCGDGMKPRLRENLDFFVFSKGSNSETLSRIDKFFSTMERSWSAKLGVKARFARACPTSRAAKLSDSLAFREMTFGHKVVYGDAQKFKRIFRKNSRRKIAPEEFAKLLMNASSELLISMKALDAEEADLKKFYCDMHKTVLACGDVLLYTLRRFRFRSDEKLAQIELLGPEDFHGIARFKDAYRLSLGSQDASQTPCDRASLRTQASEACSIALMVLKKFRSEIQANSHRTPARAIGNAWVNRKLKRHFSYLGISEGLFDNPMDAAIKISERFLAKPDSAGIDEIRAHIEILKEIK